MTCRRLISLLFRRNRPILFGIASSFVQYDPLKKPNSDEKLNLEPPDARNFTFDYMIKQSAIESVNSASQSLTVTYTAIETTSMEYRALLAKLISLLQESQMREVSEAHWDAIVMIRSKMQKKKNAVTQLLGYMEYVQKMSVAAAETSFLSGMDNLSTTLCQRIDDAINNIEKQVTQNQMLEEEYTRVQQDCILKSKVDSPNAKTEDAPKETDTPLNHDSKNEIRIDIL